MNNRPEQVIARIMQICACPETMLDFDAQKAEENTEKELAILKFEQILNEIISYYGKDETIAMLICKDILNIREQFSTNDDFKPG